VVSWGTGFWHTPFFSIPNKYAAGNLMSMIISSHLIGQFRVPVVSSFLCSADCKMSVCTAPYAHDLQRFVSSSCDLYIALKQSQCSWIFSLTRTLCALLRLE
jgi:hypothetical protein